MQSYLPCNCLRAVALTLIALCSSSACSSSALGQIVQLPTFHQFSVGTTVVVPDRGSAYLGGINRSRYHGSAHGVPLLHGLPGLGRLTGSRSASIESSAAHAFATARIHDFEAMDRALLAEAPRLATDARHATGRSIAARHRLDPKVAAKAAFLARHIGRRAPHTARISNEPSVKQSRIK
jgi:type II secretory pathway component GspD/PulD (secretin)